jgi:alpha-L-rhamnosidase
MRRAIFCILFFVLALTGKTQSWQAKWISCNKNAGVKNSFFAYRKQLTISQVPQTAIAKIAVDSKYWLWVNGKQVVFEGGLKRGPNPNDTYYDEADLAPYLKPGENIIAVLAWYFGIDGFSHKSSGKAGLLFDCVSSTISILSDKSWQCSWLEAYQTAETPAPNYRLSEASILFNATKDIGNWQSDLSISLEQAIETGNAGDAPWNALIRRPIPLWKDYGLKNYAGQSAASDNGNIIFTSILPYNAQVTPYFKIDAADAGLKIIIYTDNYLVYNGGETGIRFEYITKKGLQEFEMPGWVNGHKVYYIIPKNVNLLESKFRETGYNTSFDGSFFSSDNFFNRLWQKAARTLYVNMRDSYMDCPDRERAQWTGDAVTESAEAFYALSLSSHALSKKWLHEILDWKKTKGNFYAPVPGNWTEELPDQVLSTIGPYGLWNYYLHTGDKQMLVDFYPAIQKYLTLWELDNGITVKARNEFPYWIDRTNNKDARLVVDILFYMVLQCLQQSALALDKHNDYLDYAERLKKFSETFNQKFWNGKAYRDPAYKDSTDDRVQALAVLAGIADKSKYSNILDVLKNEEHASPYMEKYVAEALFVMGNGDYALDRLKKRFGNMVNNTQFSTLWEDWAYGAGPNGNSTVNHAWSGGGLIVLSQYLCGIAPIEPGFKTFQIIPQPATITSASAKVSSVAGLIESSFENKPGRFTLTATVPAGTECVIGLKDKYERILVNGKLFWESGTYQTIPEATAIQSIDSSLIKFKVKSGEWEVLAFSFAQSKRAVIDLMTVSKTDTVLCKGDTVVLTAGAGKIFQWYKNDQLLKNSTNHYLNIWDSGYYYVVTPGTNARLDTSRKYRVAMSIYNVPVQPSIFINDSRELVLNAGAVFQWYRNDIVVPGVIDRIYKPSDNAVYSVRTIANNCISMASVGLLYIARALVEIDEKQFITLFPNPAVDHFNLVYKLNSTQPVHVSIMASDGVKVGSFENVISNTRIPLDGLKHGVYIITLTIPGEKKQYSLRLVK